MKKRTGDDGKVVEVEFRTSGRMAQLIAGELSVEDMDDEELARGQFKDRNGNFTGRPPASISRELHDKMMQELLKRGTRKYKEAYLDSIGVFVEIAKNTRNKPADRLRAAQLVVERMAGKVPERVLVGDIDPWQAILDDVIITAGEEEATK